MKKHYSKVFAGMAMWLLTAPCIQAQNQFTVNNNGTKYNVTLPAEKNWKLIKKGDYYGVESERTMTTRADESFNVYTKGICADGVQASKVVIYNKGNMFYNYLYNKENAIDVENVIPGTYDAFMEFEGNHTLYYVFKEDIEITDKTTLEFDMSEATNAITYKFYDEEGDELFIDEYNDNNNIQRSGTADDMVKCTNFVHKDYGRTEALIMSFGAMHTGHLMEFYVNDLSKDYCIIQGTQINAYDTYYNFGSLVTDIKTQTVANDPARLKYVKTKFIPTSYQMNDENAHTPAIELQTLYHGRSIVSIAMGSYLPAKDNSVEFMVDAPCAIGGPDHEFMTTVQPMYSDAYEEVDYYGDKETKYYYMRGRYVSSNEKGIIFTASGFDKDAYGFNRVDKGLNVQYYPGLPELSYEQEEGYAEYGNYSPTLSFKTIHYTVGDDMYEMLSHKYIGRYADINEAGSRFIEPVEKETPDGREITLVNNYATVDGQPGGNEAVIFMKNSGDDMTPPTVQVLTFKDEENKTTDRFATNKGVRMIVMGGDFVFARNLDHKFKPGYFTCQDADLKMSYSVAGANDWQDLDVVVYPEKKHMPAFGNHYEADLTNANLESGWHDVKLVMTDAAGNYQSQIVKRAFYVENVYNSINEINTNKGNVIYTGREIVAAGAEKIEITSLSGSLVAETNSERMQVENLANGVYIAVAYMKDGSKVSQKIIIR